MIEEESTQFWRNITMALKKKIPCINYDDEADSIYIKLSESKLSNTKSYASGPVILNIDSTAVDRIVGVEIVNVSKLLRKR
ncbi:MAG TPA: DUF2283 domain-containing protein [Elusimicrobiales bacterium]|nr:DUF2283 domain-containing protein [Elusimicrobiales bacterium]